MDNNRPWTTDTIRENSRNWTLECDGGLLDVMRSLANNLETKAAETNTKLDALSIKLNKTSIALDNTTNKLAILQHTQFVENRVYDDDETLANFDEVPLKNDTGSNNNPLCTLNAILQNNLQMLKNCHEQVIIDLDDSDDEDGVSKSVIYRSKNPYNERPLPHIIGSKFWNDKWHIGLYDSEESFSGDEKEDEYSSSSESFNSLPSNAPTVSESEGSVWGLRINSGEKTFNSNEDDRKYLQTDNSHSHEQRFYVHKPIKSTQLFSDNSSEEDISSNKIVNAPMPLPRNVVNKMSNVIISDEPPELDVVDRERDNLFHESEEEKIQNAPTVQNLRKRPVNLFDDDDFDSFMTELGKKTEEKAYLVKTAVDDPEAKEPNQITDKDSNSIEKPTNSSNLQSLQNPKNPLISELRNKVQTLFDDESSEDDEIKSDPVLIEQMQEDSLTPITQPEITHKPQLINKKNLFNDDLSDGETWPIATSQNERKPNSSLSRDELFSAVEKATSSVSIFLQKTTNLFDDDDDDFDNLFKPHTTAQKIIIEENLETEKRECNFQNASQGSPKFSNSFIFTDNQQEYDDTFFSNLKQVNEFDESAEIKRVSEDMNEIIFNQGDEVDRKDDVFKDNFNEDHLRLPTLPKEIVDEKTNDDEFPVSIDNNSKRNEDNSSPKIQSVYQSNKDNTACNIPSDPQPSLERNTIQSESDQQFTKTTMNINLLSDVPPQDDWNDIAEIEHLPQPDVPVLENRSPTNNVSSKLSFNAIALFEDIPPPDEITESPQRSKHLAGTYYDDFDRTVVAVQSPSNYIYSDEPPEDTEIVSTPKLSVSDMIKISDSIINEVPKEKVVRSANKINKDNFNINVAALIPGCIRPQISKVHSNERTTPELSENDDTFQTCIPAIHTKNIDPDKEITGKILTNLNKGRVKCSAKRRPSTRRGRQESYRKSMMTTDELLSDINVGTKKEKSEFENNDFDRFQTFPGLSRSNISGTDDNSVHIVRATTLSPSDCIQQPTMSTENTAPNVENLTNLLTPAKSFIFHDSDSDDLFENINKSSVSQKNLDTKKFKSKEQVIDKTSKTKSLFSSDEDGEENLFGGAKKTPKSIEKKIKSLTKKHTVSLFDDIDGEDDDLFGTAKTPNQSFSVSTPTAAAIVTKGIERTKNKATPKTETSDNPLADLL